jgi:flagellar hook-associated protein 3 FlgL
LTDAGGGILSIAQNPGSEAAIALTTTTVETPATTLQSLLEPIETAANQVRAQRSLKGNIGKRLETARDHMEQIKIDMEAFRSRFEDADILETITSLQQQQQSFEAALNVTGKVSQLSILDYI